MGTVRSFTLGLGVRVVRATVPLAIEWHARIRVHLLGQVQAEPDQGKQRLAALAQTPSRSSLQFARCCIVREQQRVLRATTQNRGTHIDTFPQRTPFRFGQCCEGAEAIAGQVKVENVESTMSAALEEIQHHRMLAYRHS